MSLFEPELFFFSDGMSLSHEKACEHSASFCIIVTVECLMHRTHELNSRIIEPLGTLVKQSESFRIFQNLIEFVGVIFNEFEWLCMD